MKTVILSLGLAANLVAATGLRPRDPESDLAAFNSAADALISQYIPQPEWEALTSAVGSAASAAGVTADVKDVIYSALKATEAPSWFASVVPTAYSSQYQALETAIDSLRPTVTVTVPRPTVIAITTTDENGSTIVATTTVTPSQTTITTDVVPTPSISVVTGTDSAGNAYTSTIIGSNDTATGSAATTATETVTETTATGSASASETESVSGTGTETATSGTASGTASGTDAPSNAAPTAMANGLAGVVAVVGLVMAL